MQVNHACRHWWPACLLLTILLCFCSQLACSSVYPEIVVVNETNDFISLKNVSFSGCLWSEVLKMGDTTTVGQCLPGDDRIHFQKFDAAEYCRAQAEDATIPGICPCNEADAGVAAAPGANKFGLVNDLPFWFNYQTQSVKHARYGEFHRFVITLDDFEQDFSVPGPYGHN
jgi:hypothetical protein